MHEVSRKIYKIIVVVVVMFISSTTMVNACSCGYFDYEENMGRFGVVRAKVSGVESSSNISLGYYALQKNYLDTYTFEVLDNITNSQLPKVIKSSERATKPLASNLLQ